MQAGERHETGAQDLFRSRLDQIQALALSRDRLGYVRTCTGNDSRLQLPTIMTL